MAGLAMGPSDPRMRDAFIGLAYVVLTSNRASPPPGRLPKRYWDLAVIWTALRHTDTCLVQSSEVAAMLRLLAATSILLSGSLHAQSILEPVASPFVERLTERVPVSGRTLVGLLLIPAGQPHLGDGLATGSLSVPAPLISRGSVICIRATTQDGRYSAENSFAVKRDIPKTGRADLAWPTQYASTLRTLSLSEVAAIARSGSCIGDAEVIPVIFGAEADSGILQALVNTRGAAITVALRDPETGRTLRRANCTRVSGTSRVAFDAQCLLGTAVDLPPRVQLRLEQVSHDGLQVELLEKINLLLAN